MGGATPLQTIEANCRVGGEPGQRGKALYLALHLRALRENIVNEALAT
ncbi:MAG: hypothetical protein ACP5NQ_02910 [Vulcanisaeta sp.]